MIQRHSIILWKKDDNEKEFEEIAQEAFELFKVFDKYPEEYRPNYLTGITRKNSIKFSWNVKDFKEVLLSGSNKEDSRIFEDMGYYVSFFSALNENESCGFELRTGSKKTNFYNVFILNLPKNLDCFGDDNVELVKKLFKELVQKFKPFWGCVSNKVLSKQYGNYLEGYMPTMLHWINYWSKEIVDTVGIEKVQNIVRKYDDVFFENGILVVKETAFNVEMQSDMGYYNELQKELLA